jgi:hypothetical protein
MASKVENSVEDSVHILREQIASMELLQAQQQDQQQKRPPVVAIAADYDGCWDFIAPLGPDNMKAWPGLAHWYPDPGKCGWTFDALAELLETAIESITRERDEVYLFVGSARQSASWDRRNARESKNGSCHKAFEIMAKERGWELNRALLDDYGKSLLVPSPEHDFKWFLERADNSGTRWNADPKKSHALPERQEQLKALIITNVAAQLLRTNPDDEIDLYFFDDRVDLLEAALSVKVPDNIRLHTVWFDHYGFYTCDVAEQHQARVPDPMRPHLTALDPDGCTEELSRCTVSTGEAVKARMWQLEEPFAQKYGKNWQQISMPPSNSTLPVGNAESPSTDSLAHVKTEQ